MVWLLIVVALGGFIWWYMRKQTRQRKELAGDLATGINDTYGYLGRPVVSVDQVNNLLSKGLSPREVMDQVIDDLDDEMHRQEGALLMGMRGGNARRGLELEAHVAEQEENVDTPREYKQFHREWPAFEKRLDTWEELLHVGFPVILSREIRDRHTYVVGKSGSGKTTLLTWMIYQDIWRDQGVAFLTPEGETIEHDILPYLPADRLDEVIYLNPADERSRYGFNPLELAEGQDRDRKVEAVFSSLTRLMEGAGSARIHQILRQMIYALVEMPGATLADAPRLLDRENPHYRKQVIAHIGDDQTKRFWKSTYPQFPQNAHVPILTRLAPFLRQKRVRKLLCQPGPGLDFREIMDSGKILICNLSDGLLGEQTSQLIGGLIMSELQLAAVGRADIPPDQRRRFYVYLDEFQSFIAHGNVSYEKLLSRARKYRLPLILAHQQTGQLPTPLVREIFGNVSTLVSFLVSRRDANRIGRECVRDDRRDRPTVAPEELVTLEVGETFTKVGTRAFPCYVDHTIQDMETRPRVREQVKSRAHEPQTAEQSRVEHGKTRNNETSALTKVSEPRSGRTEVPPDPFAGLEDPQDLYGS